MFNIIYHSQYIIKLHTQNFKENQLDFPSAEVKTKKNLTKNYLSDVGTPFIIISVPGGRLMCRGVDLVRVTCIYFLAKWVK